MLVQKITVENDKIETEIVAIKAKLKELPKDIE